MTQNIKYKGQWFLPSDKDNRLYGILNYDANDGGTLELFGSFDGSAFMSPLGNEDIILGITSESKHISLYKSFVIHAGGAKLIFNEESGNPVTIYRVNYILDGVHIDSKEEMKFQKIKGEINNLDEWLGISGFARIPLPFENSEKYQLNIEYKIPEPVNFRLSESLEGKLDFSIKHPGRSAFQKSVAISQNVEFILNSKESIALEKLLINYFVFQNFIVLALYSRTYPISIKVSSDHSPL